MRAKAPLRISFCGGGTDISPCCDEYGGASIAVAINKYAYASYKDLRKANREEKTVCDYFGVQKKLKIYFYPKPMAGIGGSAAGFVAAVKLLKPDQHAYDIAKMAFDIERDRLGVLGGFQDQLASAYGGMLYMTFHGKGKAKVKRISPITGLEETLFLVYTGERSSSGPDIIEDQLKQYNLDAMYEMKLLTNWMMTAIERDDLNLFSAIVNEAWEVKKDFSPLISRDDIDDLRDWLLKNGAAAMKLCGAGGGGYALVIANDKGLLVNAMEDAGLEYEPVKFDMEGVRLV